MGATAVVMHLSVSIAAQISGLHMDIKVTVTVNCGAFKAVLEVVVEETSSSFGVNFFFWAALESSQSQLLLF